MEPLIKGHISASDFYSSTQLTTGETLIGVSSSAAYLYLNDIVTYPDNTTEPLNAIVLPYPKADKDHARHNAAAGQQIGQHKQIHDFHQLAGLDGKAAEAHPGRRALARVGRAEHKGQRHQRAA